MNKLKVVPHDHSQCLRLAGDRTTREDAAKPKNLLIYVRKSDDVEEILDALQDCLMYIKGKSGNN